MTAQLDLILPAPAVETVEVPFSEYVATIDHLEREGRLVFSVTTLWRAGRYRLSVGAARTTARNHEHTG
jgi:hypothetical protein